MLHVRTQEHHTCGDCGNREAQVRLNGMNLCSRCARRRSSEAALLGRIYGQPREASKGLVASALERLSAFGAN